MRIPEKRLSDLCKGEIVGPHVRLAYPLDPTDVSLLEPQIAQPPSLFGQMFRVTPEYWKFEFCTGCAEGFMPMLAELKTQAIAAWLDERQRRAAAPIGERDDDR